MFHKGIRGDGKEQRRHWITLLDPLIRENLVLLVNNEMRVFSMGVIDPADISGATWRNSIIIYGG